MTSGRKDDLDTDQRRARESARGLPMVPSDPGFRERLKRQFIERTIPAPPRAEKEASWFPKPVLISIALSAAAVIFLLFLSVANRGPSWEIVRPDPGARLLVDGEPLDLDRADMVEASLHSGARLAVEGSAAITFSCGEHLLIQLPVGTEITLPADPKRWLGRRLQTSITKGRLRIVTGEPFRGASLRVRTPDAEVEVLGTTLAVILEPYGTCVCVLDGSVRVHTESEPASLVPEGSRKVFYNDGRAPLVDEIRPDEWMKLERLQSL